MSKRINNVLRTTDIAAVRKAAIQRLAFLSELGVTHEQMADATGLPASSFSMWIAGTRPLVKVDQLIAVLDGLKELEKLVQAA